MRLTSGIYETYEANEPPSSQISISPYSNPSCPVGLFWSPGRAALVVRNALFGLSGGDKTTGRDFWYNLMLFNLLSKKDRGERPWERHIERQGIREGVRLGFRLISTSKS